MEQHLNITDKKKLEQRQIENNCLTIIPKTERYIQYMLDLWCCQEKKRYSKLTNYGMADTLKHDSSLGLG